MYVLCFSFFLHFFLAATFCCYCYLVNTSDHIYIELQFTLCYTLCLAITTVPILYIILVFIAVSATELYRLLIFLDIKMPESGYQVLSSERDEEVHFQFTPNVARSK